MGISRNLNGVMMTEKATPAKRPPGRPAKPKELPVEAQSEIDALKAQIEEMKALLAVQATLNQGPAPMETVNALMTPKLDQPGTKVLIHFVDDGFTYAGTTWYRGQEIEFTVGTATWQGTLDRDGNSWVALAFDERAQFRRYGRLMFRAGPWQGLGYDEAEDEAGKKIDPKLAREVAEKEARRNREAPTTVNEL